jgi:hypothetical protein
VSALFRKIGPILLGVFVSAMIAAIWIGLGQGPSGFAGAGSSCLDTVRANELLEMEIGPSGIGPSGNSPRYDTVTCDDIWAVAWSKAKTADGRVLYQYADGDWWYVGMGSSWKSDRSETCSEVPAKIREILC